jgi:hypothetical protein
MPDMGRRKFITLIGGAAVAWPLTADAQQPAMPVIGLLDTGSVDANTRFVRPFREGLGQIGYARKFFGYMSATNGTALVLRPFTWGITGDRGRQMFRHANQCRREAILARHQAAQATTTTAGPAQRRKKIIRLWRPAARARPKAHWWAGTSA